MKKYIAVFVILALAISPALAARVGVVTTFPDGRTSVTCVNAEEGAAAQDVLRATGMTTSWFSFGGELGDALTRIEDVGCPPDNPFCECGPPFECCILWNFWLLKPGQNNWEFSPVGYSNYIVQDGDVIGNIWTGDAEKPPPLKKFSELKGLCPKMKTTRSSKFYGMHTCAPPSVEVTAPEDGSVHENSRVTVEAEGSHTMKTIKTIVNGVERLLCNHCKMALKEIITRTGNNQLQVQVEDYAGRTALSDMIGFLVS